MNKLKSYTALLILLASLSALAETDSDQPLRDPTRPLAYTVKQDVAPKLVLQAIFQRVSGREAIVNGQPVRVGGSVDGARIERITQESVIYSYKGQSRVLRLRPQLIKKN